MREFRFIAFYGNPPPRKAIDRLLAEVGLRVAKDEVRDLAGNYYVRLRKEDPRLAALLKALKTANIEWDNRRELEFSDEELAACEYAQLDVDRAPRGDTSIDKGTDYDLSVGCKKCGGGSKQVSPLRMSPKAMPKSGDIFQTYNGEILVSKDLATDLKIDLRTDRGLVEAEDRKTHKGLSWWQILPDVHMPPMDKRTIGLKGPGCPICKRSGFGGDLDEHMQIAYVMPVSARRKLPGLVATWELFGVSNIERRPEWIVRFATPAILLGMRAVHVFLKRKVKCAKLTPVKFFDAPT